MRSVKPLWNYGFVALATSLAATLAGCGTGVDSEDTATGTGPRAIEAELILTNARVYSLSWDDPDGEGKPAAGAPWQADGWQPDAEAVAVRDGLVLKVGSRAEVLALAGVTTRVIDLNGATVLPGFVESHGHYNELGEQAERVDVRDASTVEVMAERLRERLAGAAPGGAWSGRSPT